MVDASSFGNQLLVEMLAGVSLALGVLRAPARPADRAAPLSALRRRIDHQPNREHRHRHPRSGCRFRGGDGRHHHPDAEHLSQQPDAGGDGRRGARGDVHRTAPPQGRRLGRKAISTRTCSSSSTGFPKRCATCATSPASQDFIDEVLTRVAEGVLAHRVAFIMGREVKQQIGVTRGEVLRWLAAFQPSRARMKKRSNATSTIALFPLRVRVEDGSGNLVGWLLVGPRPDGSIAGKDEREAIEEIVVPLARSLRDRHQPRARKAGNARPAGIASPADRADRTALGM